MFTWLSKHPGLGGLRLSRTLAITLSLALAFTFAPVATGAPDAGSARAAGEDGTDAGTSAAGRDGPVVLMGIDAEDGGPDGHHGPIANYIQLASSVLAEVSNGNDGGILVIGGGKSATDDVTRFWDAIGDGTGRSVTYANGAQDITEQSFSGFEMIAVASSSLNTRSGGLTAAENDAISQRDTDIANFVNLGGGLIGLEQEQFADPFAYVGALGEFEASNYFYSQINPTEAGEAVGITDALSVCCWHQVFDTFPDFLAVLATEAQSGTNQVAAVGGRISVPPPAVDDEQTIGACTREQDRHANSGNGACVEDPVNTATGAFELAAVDLMMAGIGLPFELTRTYSSANPHAGPMGLGWIHSFDAGLEIDGDGTVTFRAEDGQRVVYEPLGDGTYQAATGGHSTLRESSDRYELMRPDQVTYHFDAGGRLVSLSDRNDNQLTLAYDSDGRLATVTDTVGRQIGFTHDSDGQLTGVALPDGRATSYSYTDGLLTEVVDAAGETTTYEYDAEGRLTREIDAAGATVVVNTYGEDGRVIEQLDPLGNKSTFEWDEQEQTATITDAAGEQWTYVYSNNVLLEATDPTGATVRYDYDRQVNVSVVTDERGNTTLLRYDHAGNLVEATAPDPLGYVETFEYDEANNLTAHTDGRGNTTELEYDDNGNLIEIREPGGATTVFVHDPEGTGLTTQVTDPLGETTTMGYDDHGNLTTITSPEGQTTTFGYDEAGRVVAVVDPRGNVEGADPEEFTTVFAYDSLDRLTDVTDPLDNTTTIQHNAVGEVVAQTDASGRTTSYDYDAARRLTAVIASDGATTAYSYDAAGNLVERIDANGGTTSYSYDPARRLTEVITPAGGRWEYAHDAAGNLTQVVDANATTGVGPGITQYGYDELNRLTSITYVDDTPDVQFAYDAAGNRTSMSDGADTVEYSYDFRNRLTQVARGSEVFTYDYDLLGNVVSRTYPDGATVAYGYDAAGRLVSVTEEGETTVYGYDPAGNLVETRLPNGQIGSYSYDAAGQRIGVAWGDATGALSELTYELDAVGNPTTVHDPVEEFRVDYAYDVRNQLTEVCYDADCSDFLRYTYDDLGNRLTEQRPEGTTQYTYDADNRLTATDGPEGIVDYAHDPNGNRIQAGSVTYSYDLANRLVEVGGPGGDPSAVLDGGFYHSLGLEDDGSVYGWGRNSSGQLGDGTTTNRNVPTQVDGLSAVGVAAGGNHSLALTVEGTVAAWGSNAYGQLGDGTNSSATSPVEVADLDDVTAIAGGNYHSLAVDGDGTVWGWGFNGSGQLGDGTTTTRSTPVAVNGLTDVVDVAAGGLPGWSGHSAALREDGTVWTWGYNKEGQLGDGTRNHRHEPAQVEGLEDIIAVAAAGDNTYALKDDGTVWAWGDNSYDQLGNEDARRRSPVPVQVDIADVIAIGAGGTHVLAVKEDGTVWAWGNNNTGQLGNDGGGPGDPKTSATPVQAEGLSDAITVAGGYVHSLSALDDETGWAWGRNAEGQLGDGTTSMSRVPVQVSELDAVAPTPSVHATYSYDGDGTRLTGTVGSQTTDWLWDVNAPLPLLVSERDADGAPIRDYRYGAHLLAQIDAEGERSFYHHDHLGSTTHLTGADGQPQVAYDYEPFGALRDEQHLTDDAPENPMRFTGEYQDAETGLYHLRARQYDPGTGSFLGVDPLPPAATDPYVSAYIYVHNRPTVFVDPSGLVKQNAFGLVWTADRVADVTSRPASRGQLLGCVEGNAAAYLGLSLQLCVGRHDNAWQITVGRRLIAGLGADAGLAAVHTTAPTVADMIHDERRGGTASVFVSLGRSHGTACDGSPVTTHKVGLGRGLGFFGFSERMPGRSTLLTGTPC